MLLFPKSGSKSIYLGILSLQNPTRAAKKIFIQCASYR